MSHTSAKVVRLLQRLGHREEGGAVNTCGACQSRHPPTSMCSWQACDHAVCENCLWQKLRECTINEEIDCPFCHAPASPPSPQEMAAKMSALPENRRAAAAAASLQRFQKLEASWAREDKAKAKKKRGGSNFRRKTPRFVALPLAESASQLLGTTQEQRSEKLLAAADVGEPKRIAALCEAGVDIEVKDEYGQTALFIAATLGHASAVFILLSFGADPDAALMRAPAPSTPPYVAAMRLWQSCCGRLAQHLQQRVMVMGKMMIKRCR